MKRGFIFSISVFLIFFILLWFMNNGYLLYAQLTDQKSFKLLPENGHFNAYIVVSEQATEIERYAADELSRYIEKMTGSEIPVIKEKHNLDHFAFFIGQTQPGKHYAQHPTSIFNGANGFRIKSVSNGLVIAGGDDLSTLYGVYAFLEEYQGCGFFMAYDLYEVVPRNKGIIIPENLDVTQIPDIPIRWLGEDDWALKNRMNTQVTIHGHNVGVINKWNYHTYSILVPDELYFEDHPEYFSLAKTKRIRGDEKEHGQLCTSNPEVIRLVTQHLIDELKRNPDIDFISLTANDWFGFCRCSRCSALMEPEREKDYAGSASSRVHIFNNVVAQRVKKYCPDQFIKVGAYQGYYRYPLDPLYRPEDNLAIQVTPNIHHCHNHLLTDPDCPLNAQFMEDFPKWTDNARHLHIYGYTCLGGWIMLPWPIVHCLRHDVPYYHKAGAEMYFTQYWYQNPSYALNYYIASKLGWDSSLDVDDLISEFCNKLYGSAGPAMEKYFRFLEDSFVENDGHLSYKYEPVMFSIPRFFTPEVVSEANRLLREAENVETDSLSGERIHLIRTDFDYLQLVLNYFSAISEPFEGLDPDKNPVRWNNAIQQAASIGEVLSNTIYNYVDENFSDEMILYRRGLEFYLQVHTMPQYIPGARHESADN